MSESKGKLRIVAENYNQACYFAQSRSLGFTDWQIVATVDDLRDLDKPRIHLVEGWHRRRDVQQLRVELRYAAAHGAIVTGAQLTEATL